jgi:GT2 family glycosyltransferase
MAMVDEVGLLGRRHAPTTLQPNVISPRTDDITIVLPTYDRAEALRANLGSVLALHDVAEVIIVDDGSTDDTLAVCREFVDDRLRVISHAVNRGVATARNTGVAAATGSWVLFGEDDCRFPADYATVLRAEAERHSADLVGAPLLYSGGTEEEVAAFAAAAPRVESLSMENVSAFPLRAVETPFIPARALVRKSVFDRVSFHEGFPVNGYREETDFFVQAVRAGFCSVLTPATYCYQPGHWGGGQHHSSTLRYEYWTLRNNWRFLRRHSPWLVERGYIRGALLSQLQFALARVGMIVSGVARARVLGARAALSRARDPSPAN